LQPIKLAALKPIYMAHVPTQGIRKMDKMPYYIFIRRPKAAARRSFLMCP
jgi:hypothetical protein